LNSLKQEKTTIPPLKFFMKKILSVLLLCFSFHSFAASVSLDPMLEGIRSKNHFPAMAAVVLRGDETVGIGAVGLRKSGGSEHVTTNDLWHIGSCTKSMTASLAAMLVDEGKLRWDMTLPELFPNLATEMRSEWKSVTLEELLSHHGGVSSDLKEENLWGRLWERVGKTPLEQRTYLALELLTKQVPVVKPGTKYLYSNAGYALVGHAIELKLGIPWEQALTERLFKPLGMTSAGFGAPATAGKEDQPWGHSGKNFAPVQPGGIYADNPAAIGPGATVHCSLPDLAKYAAWHLKGERGQGTLLKPETFKRLHTVVGKGDYALGWIVMNRRWAGGKALTHSGSNNMFYTVIWIAPEKNAVIIVCANVGVDYAFTGCDKAVGKLIQQYLK